ncbi:MAG: DUF1640 domain-containing protein [bacterium]|nr:DUF1640 domain-containing protein [bacterium]
MMTAVDTLSIYERLKEATLNESAAKEIAEVIKDVTEAHVATKDDVEKAVEKAKVEIIKWVAGMLVAQAAIVATLVKLL